MSLIYHHTTTEGLIGILESEAIWATDIRFLNDYEELIIGINNLESICKKNKELKAGSSYEKEMNCLYDAFNKYLQENLNRRSTFIASFTKTKDNLRQWMAYGKANSSYSIGFERSMIEKLEKINSNDLVYNLTDVEYEMNTKLESSLDVRLLEESILKGRQSPSIALDFFRKGMLGCCSIKRKEFSDENETRMVFQTRTADVPYSDSRYRNWGGIVAPYINVPIPKSSIKEIIIGPNINSELAKIGLNSLLDKKNIRCEVLHSKCTLRQL